MPVAWLEHRVLEAFGARQSGNCTARSFITQLSLQQNPLSSEIILAVADITRPHIIPNMEQELPQQEILTLRTMRKNMNRD
jgi:hypothetical protein